MHFELNTLHEIWTKNELNAITRLTSAIECSIFYYFNKINRQNVLTEMKRLSSGNFDKNYLFVLEMQVMLAHLLFFDFKNHQNPFWIRFGAFWPLIIDLNVKIYPTLLTSYFFHEI